MESAAEYRLNDPIDFGRVSPARPRGSNILSLPPPLDAETTRGYRYGEPHIRHYTSYYDPLRGFWPLPCQGDRRGSNPRPQGPQPCALPTELRPPFYVLTCSFLPPLSAVSIRTVWAVVCRLTEPARSNSHRVFMIRKYLNLRKVFLDRQNGGKYSLPILLRAVRMPLGPLQFVPRDRSFSPAVQDIDG